MTDPGPQDAQRFDIAKIVVLSGWSLTIAICLAVIICSIYLALTKGDLDTLDKWAGMCLGFLLGNFVTLVKDFIKVSP